MKKRLVSVAWVEVSKRRSLSPAMGLKNTSARSMMHSWYATQSGPVRHMDMQFERKCRMSYGVHASSCSYHLSLTPARSCFRNCSSLACDRKCGEEEEEEEEGEKEEEENDDDDDEEEAAPPDDEEEEEEDEEEEDWAESGLSSSQRRCSPAWMSPISKDAE